MIQSEGAKGDSSEEFACSVCGKDVKGDFDFCPHCGAIFSEDIVCDKHGRRAASGVCIVCGTPCCDECGTMVNSIFLCNRHGSYEIYEGMVKVFGSHAEAEAEVAKSHLDDAGLHPVLLHLQKSKDRAHVEYEPYDGGEDFNSSEIKVMVPCKEVAEAEKVLKNPPAIS